MENINLKIISAGAGSGKTYRLTQELTTLLVDENLEPRKIIATTFTKKAAAELKDRVQQSLIDLGKFEEAEELELALIGTVHSVCTQLLKRYAFDIGISPKVTVMADEDALRLFERSISHILDVETIERLTALEASFGVDKEGGEWQKVIFNVANLARTNKLSEEGLEASKELSTNSFFNLLGAPNEANFFADLRIAIGDAINQLEGNTSDTTKKTAATIQKLKSTQTALSKDKEIPWFEVAKLAGLGVSVKSKDLIEPLLTCIDSHESFDGFRADVRTFIEYVFDLANKSIVEYQRFKQERGLVDYNDMEFLLSELLQKESIQASLKEEVSLLMVDEFQDTSPLQLDIFWTLSKVAKQAIWVGDPKQSIYGFRGAEPALMLDLIRQTGGLDPANIQDTSYRSRSDLVNFSNAVFTEAFSDMDASQVVLKPFRVKDEAAYDSLAIKHWQLLQTDDKVRETNEWTYRGIALQVARTLEEKITYQNKTGEKKVIEPRDIAILFRKNSSCEEMADMLNQLGIKTVGNRNGLFKTFEIKILNATFRFLLNKKDTLAIAELAHFVEEVPLPDLVNDRLQRLSKENEEWTLDKPIFHALEKLRPFLKVYSPVELLQSILDKTPILVFIQRLSNPNHRVANVEVLKKMVSQYEGICERRRSAATLGGLLNHFSTVESDEKDFQATSAENAVQVLTYHKSKGLEWPMVVLGNLSSTAFVTPWSLEISSTDTVDLNNILANRLIRYWPNPYGKSWRKTQFAKTFDSTIGQAALANATRESARVLYVGVTRARDFLILPTSEKVRPKWLNECSLGDSKSELLVDEREDMEFKWNQLTIPKENCSVSVVDIEPIEVERTGTVRVFQKTKQTEEHIAYLVNQIGNSASTRDFQVDSYSSTRLDLKESEENQLMPILGYLVRKSILDHKVVSEAFIKQVFEQYLAWEPSIELFKGLLEWSYQTIQGTLGTYQLLEQDLIISIAENGQLGKFKLDMLVKTSTGLWVLALMQQSEIGDTKQFLRRLASLKGSVSSRLENKYNQKVKYAGLAISNQAIIFEK